MKRPHISLLAGLAICVATAILVICKIEDHRKNRTASSAILIDESITSVEPNQSINGDNTSSARRQRAKRGNLSMLSRLGYELTADHIGDHNAKGNVKIVSPNGINLRSDSMSISLDGTNIFLHGSVTVQNKSAILRMFKGADSFARIALDGSSQSFTGTSVLFEPGSSFIGQSPPPIDPPPIDFISKF
jgi:hypothetical protein